MNPNLERSKLGFMDAVLSSFGFLSNLGFRAVERDITFVRYESSRVFVNVYHGRGSFELGVEVGRLRKASEKVTLHEIIAWVGAGQAEGFGQHVTFQVSTREGVQEFVPKLAGLVQKYGIPLLKADAAAYREIHAVSARWAAQYEKEVALGHMRQKADAAWHAKDYFRVVELYKPAGPDLSVVEARRLAYAEQRILQASKTSSTSSSYKKV